jgi:hypothetical protein
MSPTIRAVLAKYVAALERWLPLLRENEHLRLQVPPDVFLIGENERLLIPAEAECYRWFMWLRHRLDANDPQTAITMKPVQTRNPDDIPPAMDELRRLGVGEVVVITDDDKVFIYGREKPAKLEGTKALRVLKRAQREGEGRLQTRQLLARGCSYPAKALRELHSYDDDCRRAILMARTKGRGYGLADE